MNDIKIDSGVVTLHGKEYRTVALRVNEFREAHPDWGIETRIIEVGEKTVLVQAIIKDPTGRIISTGLAEESRNSSPIHKTSALEVCETSAVGRALAFFGLAGSEIASADELAAAIGTRAVTAVDLSTELSAIEAAADLDALKDVFSSAYSAHRGDGQSQGILSAAKDRRKRVLSVTGVFNGKEVAS